MQICLLQRLSRFTLKLLWVMIVSKLSDWDFLGFLLYYTYLLKYKFHFFKAMLALPLAKVDLYKKNFQYFSNLGFF